jgi:hypothetical protein
MNVVGQTSAANPVASNNVGAVVNPNQPSSAPNVAQLTTTANRDYSTFLSFWGTRNDMLEQLPVFRKNVHEVKLNQTAEQVKIRTIVVSRPGVMRDSLRAGLIGSAPYLEIIKMVGDGLNALEAIRVGKPRLLVIDSNLLEEEIKTLLRHVKQEWPAICCLVLAESSYRQKNGDETDAPDAVWPRHRSLRELAALLHQLCPDM